MIFRNLPWVNKDDGFLYPCLEQRLLGWASFTAGFVSPVGDRLVVLLQRKDPEIKQESLVRGKNETGVPHLIFCLVCVCERVYVLAAGSPFLSAGTELRGVVQL